MTRSDAAGNAYRLILFVAGDEVNSRLARRNLAEVCEQDLQGRCEVQVVDVLEDYMAALEHNIVVTPTLLIEQPQPQAVVVGNLSDRAKVRMALRLESE